ncbi:putative PEP-CTERM system histidine kinase [Verrucomicrobiia bacterium DG1235]|nr:putative PEP-CTERM system histidine kinase [Verrucomicrobiae bacterium DG1235]
MAAVFVAFAPFSKRHTLPQWSFSLGMLALAVEQLLTGLAIRANQPLEIAQLIRWRFVASAFLPGLWLLFAATYSRGNVKEKIGKRLPIIVLAFIVPILLVLLAPDHLARLTKDPLLPFQWSVHLEWAGFFLHIVFLLSMIGALVGLERTYRASVGTLRWKIKFMLFGMGTLFAARFFTSSQIVLAQEIDQNLESVNAAALLICCLLVGRSLLRRGSFEIDLYPSQSIISGSVVISLAGAYLIIVGVLSKVIGHLGGDQAFAIQTFLILIALVGLVLLVQSDRARQIVRRFVSRNFQRPLYDYRTLWLKVTNATSQSVREKDICLSTTKLLSNLFDTKLTSIWLLEPSNTQFLLAASSDQKTDQNLDSEATHIEAGSIPEELLAHPAPINLDKQKESWTKTIVASNTSRFPKGGNRILVPLTGQERVVGFMVLGDRTNTLKFTQQEFDTLSCISDHVAASLLSAALTRKLEESNEIEAFQTMATFFVHDLKNAVSTLNLMLKNMPKHWDNPEFRADALRGLGNTSERITNLINRLSQVRHELEISPQKLDLSELANHAIKEWEQPSHVQFESSLSDDLQIRADKIKLKSVILNLVINACEAIDEDGKIALRTERDGSHAVLNVTDSGCGMSDEFIRSSLFRPFKTTKKSGLGIGIFQSKMIVEAHGGSITVVSRENHGSTFSIRLPLA